jgi:cytochrome c oxidase assembly protein subunit 20
MADDTRQPQPPQSDPAEQLEYKRPRKPKPKHDFPQTQAGKMWDALGNPENPVNSMPGGTYNSAGGKPREVSWRDAFNFDLMKTERPAFYQTGCGRDSLLVGIGAGGAVGGLSFILRGEFIPSIPSILTCSKAYLPC